MTLRQLDHLRSLSAMISDIDERILRLRSRAERLTVILTGMPSGHDRQEMDDIIAEIIEQERKAGEREVELCRECEEATAWIRALPEQQRRVMWAYYIDNMKTWQDVAEKLPYSYKHTLRIRDAAHAKLEKMSTYVQ